MWGSDLFAGYAREGVEVVVRLVALLGFVVIAVAVMWTWWTLGMGPASTCAGIDAEAARLEAEAEVVRLELALAEVRCWPEVAR